jgi:protease II
LNNKVLLDFHEDLTYFIIKYNKETNKKFKLIKLPKELRDVKNNKKIIQHLKKSFNIII